MACNGFLLEREFGDKVRAHSLVKRDLVQGACFSAWALECICGDKVVYRVDAGTGWEVVGRPCHLVETIPQIPMKGSAASAELSAISLLGGQA